MSAASAQLKCARIEARLARVEMILDSMKQMLKLDVPYESGNRVRFVQKLVAKQYGLAVGEMLKGGRAEVFFWPRSIAMRLAREETGLSLPSLAYHFDEMHHTTLVNALKSLEERLETDAAFRGDFDALRRRVGAQLGGRRKTRPAVRAGKK